MAHVTPPRSRRLILMITTAARGGMRSVVDAYVRDGLAARYSVRILFSHAEGGWVRRIAFAFRTAVQCAALLLRRRVAAMHLHVAMYGSFWRKTLFSLLARPFGVPTIMHLHGSDFHLFFAAQPACLKRCIVAQLQSCETVIVLSERWRAFVSGIAPRARIEIIPNYVNVPPARPHFPSNPAHCTFFFSGQICVRKGIFDLLPALQLVRSSNPSVHLRVAGDGDLQQAIALTQELNIANAVTFLGWLPPERVSQELASADAFVLPSYNEGLPMSLLEAMAAALPVISTPVGGIPEVVGHGVNGLIAEAGNVRSIADNMLALANDAGLRAELGSAARDTIQKRYSPEAVLPRLERLYQRLLG